MVDSLKEYKFGFEKLEVWQLSIDFAKNIYKLTNKFPKEEIYGLTSQIKRATVSVSSNIAEGTGKSSLKDQMRFMEIAFGSLMEVLNQLILACELNYINDVQLNEYREKVELIAYKLSALKNSQQRRLNEK
jgi:four helix bundle protein